MHKLRFISELKQQEVRTRPICTIGKWTYQKFPLEGNFSLWDLNTFLSVPISNDRIQQMHFKVKRSKNVLVRKVFLAATRDHWFFFVCPGQPRCW